MTVATGRSNVLPTVCLDQFHQIPEPSPGLIVSGFGHTDEAKRSGVTDDERASRFSPTAVKKPVSNRDSVRPRKHKVREHLQPGDLL